MTGVTPDRVYDRREYLGEAGGVTGTMKRNHIGAVHVLRLHRAIHSIHVTT
eukprot:COSAG02_NODE_5271_length_4480_cov_42.859849_5_plen_51_part_00